MKKKLLEQFINKYNLGGLVEAVRWVSDDNGLQTSFISGDQSVIGFVYTPSIHLTNHAECNIADTVPLRKMLGVLSDEIELSIEFTNNKPSSVLIKDDSTKGTLILSDPGAIPNPVKVGTVNPDLVIKLTSKFITTYTKACSAVADTDTVSFVVENGVPQVIVGYDATEENLNSNIALSVETLFPTKPFSPVTFPSKPLREVLLANAEMTSGAITVDKRGIAQVRCDLSDFDVTYFLTRKNR